jgi:5,10-methylenetetrahydromethanopterin reductase
VTAVRTLLDGGELTSAGRYFTSDAVRLVHPPPAHVPLYLGVSGPRLLGVSGRHADGTLINFTAPPAYVRWARQQVDAARLGGGYVGVHRFPVIARYSVDHDGAQAKAVMRTALASVLAALGPTAITDCYGISEQLVGMIARGGAEVVAREMPVSWIDDMTIAGTPAECAAKIDAYLAAGADTVFLCPGSDTDSASLTAAEVAPLLGRRAR